MIDKIQAVVKILGQHNPLVLNITNYVTMDIVANCQLAVGAAPLMSVCEQELTELIHLASAIVINIGTLNEAFMQLARKAALLAQQFDKPLVLDPVGCGATTRRTMLSRELMPYANIVCGNASEIFALIEDGVRSHGVESSCSTSDVKTSAIKFANKKHITLAITGEEDFITDGTRQQSLYSGSPLMAKVTGMGCATTGVIAAFCSVTSDPFDAASLALAYVGQCGEYAATNADGPGAFRGAFIDALFSGFNSNKSCHNNA